LTALFDSHALKIYVGSVLSLEGARAAHEILSERRTIKEKIFDVDA
jgi:hypothetical protein